ncbi:anti-sigma factor antagonist [soil metagenome]
MHPFGAQVEGNKVVLTGEVDMEAAADLRQALDEAARLDGSGLFVDLSAVTFIDSSGLRELTGALRYGNGVTLLGVGTATRRLLEITALDQVFTVE